MASSWCVSGGHFFDGRGGRAEVVPSHNFLVRFAGKACIIHDKIAEKADFRARRTILSHKQRFYRKKTTASHDEKMKHTEAKKKGLY